MTKTTKTTLFVIMFYLLAAFAAGAYLYRDFRSTVRSVMSDTAELVGLQLHAALSTAIDAQVNDEGATPGKELAKTLFETERRSELIRSLTVADRNGLIIADDDTEKVGTRIRPFAAVFEEPAEPFVDSDFRSDPRFGIHYLYFPVKLEGRIEGYLLAILGNRQIVELFSYMISSFVAITVLGLMMLIGLGGLFQYQLNVIGTRLSRAFERLGKSDSVENSLDQSLPAASSALASLSARVRQSMEDYELGKRRIDTLSRAFRVGIIQLSDQGDIEFMSREALELLNLAEESEASRWLADNRPALQSATGSLAGNGANHTRFRVVAGSEDKPRSLQVDVYALTGGRRNQYLLLVRDRDVIESLDDDLRAATRLRGLSTLYMGTAHDLRAPINAIVVNLDLLSEALDDLEAQSVPIQDARRYGSVIREEMLRLQRLLSSFLEQTRPTGASRPERTDVAAVIEDIGRWFRPHCENRDVKLDIDIGMRPAYIRVDEGHFRQALVNVLVNATEAMNSGGRIRVSTAAKDGSIGIATRDTGPGIPRSLQDRVFDMHFTTKGTGTGIGLYVVKSIVEGHGGQVELESEPGRGTVVTMWFDTVDDSDESLDKKTSSTPLFDPAADGQ